MRAHGGVLAVRPRQCAPALSRVSGASKWVAAHHRGVRPGAGARIASRALSTGRRIPDDAGRARRTYTGRQPCAVDRSSHPRRCSSRAGRTPVASRALSTGRRIRMTLVARRTYTGRQPCAVDRSLHPDDARRAPDVHRSPAVRCRPVAASGPPRTAKGLRPARPLRRTPHPERHCASGAPDAPRGFTPLRRTPFGAPLRRRRSRYTGAGPKWRNGRRDGLKNRWASRPVWVRLPPSAPRF